MIRYLNNPLDFVIEAVNELYPGTTAEIQFDPFMHHFQFLFINIGYCGGTVFPAEDEKDQTPIINISAHIPFGHMPEILAHEFAHVIAGEDHDHDATWERIFNEIYDKANEIAENVGKICEEDRVQELDNLGKLMTKDADDKWCIKCGYNLGKIDIEDYSGKVKIICPRCKSTNIINVERKNTNGSETQH